MWPGSPRDLHVSISHSRASVTAFLSVGSGNPVQDLILTRQALYQLIRLLKYLISQGERPTDQPSDRHTHTQTDRLTIFFLFLWLQFLSSLSLEHSQPPLTLKPGESNLQRSVPPLFPYSSSLPLSLLLSSVPSSLPGGQRTPPGTQSHLQAP